MRRLFLSVGFVILFSGFPFLDIAGYGLLHRVVEFEHLVEVHPRYRFLNVAADHSQFQCTISSSHREDVANIVIGFLAGSGLQWHREIFEREWPGILRDALARLSAKKR
jgi:hypothetical protein